MTTKHAPGTPLPWHLGVKQLERIVYDEKGWAITNATVYHGHADDPDCRNNAAYIAHAANAYPKLVEALRSAMDAISAEYCGHDGQCGADVKGCYVRKFAALLRELGED